MIKKAIILECIQILKNYSFYKSGDLMNVEKLKDILAKNNTVTFKLYSLEYVISIIDNHVQIYSPTYLNDIRTYNNINELLNNFRVYNETLLESENRIVVYE